MTDREVSVSRRLLIVRILSTRVLQSGLLINVVRTLTTSASEDQRELAKQRIERGHAESSRRLDRLLNGCTRRIVHNLLLRKRV